METFTHIDNGCVPDRWPHTPQDILPSVKVLMNVDYDEVGYAVVTIERSRLVSLFIKKPYRGKGYGEKLLSYVLAAFSITNFYAVPHDGLIDLGRIISWYQRHGFSSVHGIEMVKS